MSLTSEAAAVADVFSIDEIKHHMAILRRLYATYGEEVKYMILKEALEIAKEREVK